MQIEKNNRLYKVFMWCLGIVGKFTGNSVDWNYRKYKEQTDLCHFFRVICIYTPIVIILNLLAYAGVAAVLILPFFLFTLADLGKTLLVMGLSLAGCAGIIYVIYIFADHKIQRTETYQVAAAYIKAKKAKICPYITFK